MNDLYLTTVTFTGLHYKRTGKGGGYSAPSPCAVEPDAYGASFDLETLTLTWLIPNPPSDEVEQEPSAASYTFTAEEIEEGKVFVTTPKPAPVPTEVSPKQIRLALNAAGLREMVEDAVAAADQPTQDSWNWATCFLRTDPMLTSFCAAIGWTEEQIDQLFIDASKY